MSRQLVVCFAASAMVTQAAFAQQTDVAVAIQELGFRVISPPATPFEVGGVVVPGHEEIGTTLRSEVVGLLLAAGGGALQTTAAQLPTGGLPANMTQNACVQRPNRRCSPETRVSVVAWQQQSLTNPTATPDAIGSFAARLSEVSGVPAEALQSHVVVTDIVVGEFSRESCASAGACGRVVFGYRAGLALKTAAAAGRGRLLSVLQPFELDKRAVDRNVTLKAILVTPSPSQVGWIDRVRVGRRDPIKLQDRDFTWLGPAPIGVTNLWAGQFFFRVRTPTVARTVQRDISLADHQMSLRLSTQ